MLQIRIKKSSEFKIRKRFKLLKNLLIPLVSPSGRSNIGHIILFGRGGRYKRFYRIIDFKRLIINIPAKVINFEYDPNRGIFIMLLLYINGVITYSLAPRLVRVNTYIFNNELSSYKSGTAFPLASCLAGSFVHCVKINTLTAKYARAAGTFVQIIRKVGSYVLLRLASKEELFVYSQNDCILGRLSTGSIKFIKHRSAGYQRRLGFKSKVRGVAKNPIDHPHGGGEGRTTAGQPSVSPWGVYTKGPRTTSRFKRLNLNKWGFFRRRDKKVW